MLPTITGENPQSPSAVFYTAGEFTDINAIAQHIKSVFSIWRNAACSGLLAAHGKAQCPHVSRIVDDYRRWRTRYIGFGDMRLLGRTPHVGKDIHVTHVPSYSLRHDRGQ